MRPDGHFLVMKFAPLGDSALLVELGDAPEKISALTAAILKAKPAGILDVVPAHSTVAVHYDPVRFSQGEAACPHEALCQWLKTLEIGLGEQSSALGRELCIPVCYGGDHGPDLAVLAAAKKLSPEAVIRLHSEAVYRVRAIGFSPGFPYLDGLPEILHMPRKTTPRKAVPAGSVGIGGDHTGIYTLETPGGWHLLGRTPLRLFQPEASEPALLKVGDRVRFAVITPAQFDAERRGSS